MAINMAATACQRQRYQENGHCPLELPIHLDEVDDSRCYGLTKWRNSGRLASYPLASEFLLLYSLFGNKNLWK